MHGEGESGGFSIAVLVALALAGLMGLMVLMMQLQPGFMGMAHGTDPIHRTHDATYALLFTMAVVGMMAQLWRPSNNVAGQLMALLPWAALLLAAVLSGDAGVIRSAERILVGVATIVAASIHPARRDFLRALRLSRVSWPMLSLAVLAAVPLLVYAATNVGLQRTIPDEHAAMGHYGFMAAFSFAIVGSGLLTSLRPPGWRLTAWVTGGLLAMLAAASLALPGVSSSLSPLWATAAIAWSAIFIATAEFTKRRSQRETTDLTPRPNEGAEPMTDPSTPSGPPKMPRWVKISGIVALVLLFVFVILLATGIGGEHGPMRHAGPGGGAPTPTSGTEPTSGTSVPTDADDAARTETGAAAATRRPS